MIKTYFGHVQSILANILDTEMNALEQASEAIRETCEKGGVIHLFGTGHSHIFSEEVFYRAGGLANVSPILVEPLMLHEGAARSSALERESTFAETFLDSVDFRPEDVLFVASTSGRNPVPIDVALHAKEKGVSVIVLTSLTYSKAQTSKHASGQKLYDVADIILDTHAPIGDAVISIPGLTESFAPVSTAIGVAILQAIFAEAIAALVKDGIQPPIFLSGNMDGADEHNNQLFVRYADRIPLLMRGMSGRM